MSTTDIYLHIPKCGGSSLRTLFAQNYSSADIISFAGYRPELDWFRATPPEYKARYRLIQGHVPYGVHEGLMGSLPGVRYVTLFRDPVERHFSEIKYGLRSPYHPLHGEFASGRLSLDRWATYPETDPYFENTITRYLTGGPDILDVDTRASRLTPVSTAELAIAKERLLGFAAFGFADDFTRSVLLIGKALGWKTVAYAVRNVSPETPIAPEAYAAAKSHFAMDMDLLRFARALYEERVRMAGTLLEDAAVELDAAIACALKSAPDQRYQEYVLGVSPVPPSPEISAVPRQSAIDRFLVEAS
ncbi:hypothetical protein [Azospirillum picis]|uniref:Sulfotransferase family protein n=1 Tax=Azospirillum picis TaxID=488438 RepID=A0ABU0MUJ3_9PROT|nr:hypothetical protein [Azospirillum picis]MBP2303204.1 hypothetical protein [Azospirillum picis]MDQ0536989.1 hypothetical protein [Azospirillum picis]